MNKILSFFVDSRGQLRPIRAFVTLSVALIVCLVVSAFQPFHNVPTGSRGVITRFGAITGIQPEGLVLLWPNERLNIFNIRAEKASVNNAEGSTFDTQPVHVSLTVQYSVMTNRVSEVFEKYSKDGDLSSYISTATQDAFKTVTARYTAPDLIAKREQVGKDLVAVLGAKIDKYGAQVLNIDMVNFAFDPSYMKAINDKVTQEQQRLAEENRLRTIEVQQRQKVVTAEAEATAAKVRADGEAYSKLKVATADAEALRITNAAIAQNKDILELERIKVSKIQAERWNGALPVNLYGSAPIPYMQLPAPGHQQ